MAKKYATEDLEGKIFQITIADLANTNNPPIANETIEFKDTKITFELFKTIFFDNNYNYFELSNQFRDYDQVSINNKVITKSTFFKNYIGGTKVNIIDILILKYMQNKKTRLDDISRISLLKDFNTYDSLIDFKIYNNQLSLDDVKTLFRLYDNKHSKKYFRFKIKATYYSSALDETISMYFNYLVKIPKDCFKNIKKPVVDDESYEESVFDDKELENFVYSNYNKKIQEESVDIKDGMYDLVESDADEDDADDASETNMSEISYEVNESTESFF